MCKYISICLQVHHPVFSWNSLQYHIAGVANWQELLELAQRKFLRQVIQYADAMEMSPFPRLFVLDFLSAEEKASLITVEEPASEPADEQVHQCPLAAAEAADDAYAAATAAENEAAEVVSLLCSQSSVVKKCFEKLERRLWGS